jgi:hypothetical protein
MLTPVAERKRPVGRANPRLTIEVYPQDAELVHRFRLAALSIKTTLREWLLDAGRQRLERELANGDHSDTSDRS